MTFEKFISFTPRDKLRNDPFMSRILYRPLSFYIGYILFHIKIRANHVSMFATFIVFPICILMCAGWINLALALAIIFSIADCIDGNLARVENEIFVKSGMSYGSWLDACSGYVFYALFPISIGVFCETQGDLFGIDGVVQIVGSLVAVTNILLRLIHQKLLNEKNEAQRTERQSRNKFLLHFKGEVGFLGFMLPLCYLTFYTGTLEFLLLFYLFIYSVGLIKFYLSNIDIGTD
ncbi:CDP-alcohol phosphatidyltransferase family protein [Planktomarina sp.]|nr:CDP-alcohol phosphatidyltransferase family protein [Planktomarina sp.]